MKATIISVGNEILLGKTINTNLAFLASSLFSLGIETKTAICISDDEKEIHKALKNVETSLVILTGGLGPTRDDATKESVASYYNFVLERNDDIVDKMAAYFERMGRTMDPSNEKQAYFPKNAIILENERGTAPGAIIPVNGKHIVLLPGPPSELQPMFEGIKNYLKPFLNETIYQRGYLVAGVGESDLESEMGAIYDDHPDVNIAPYASLGEIRYIFTSKDEAKLQKALMDFKKHFKTHIVGPFDQSFEELVINTLNDQGKTIALVESCTGGMLASRLVNVSGASKVFHEGYVLYDNEAKVKQLGVNQVIIDKFGAVSDQCVYELAYQLTQKTSADVSVSISGIAGPEGGTKDKPVGTVYFGICHEGKTKTFRRVFSGDRQMIRQKASSYALFLVMNAVMHNEDLD